MEKMKTRIDSRKDRTYSAPFAEPFFVKLDKRFLDSYKVGIKEIVVEEEDWD